jgi:hypothetical protein
MATTEAVYRRELRPVISTGAEVMDTIFSIRRSPVFRHWLAPVRQRQQFSSVSGGSAMPGVYPGDKFCQEGSLGGGRHAICMPQISRAAAAPASRRRPHRTFVNRRTVLVEADVCQLPNVPPTVSKEIPIEISVISKPKSSRLVGGCLLPQQVSSGQVLIIPRSQT